MKKFLVTVFLVAMPMCAQAAPPHSITINWGWAQGNLGAATSFNVKRGTVTGGPYITQNTHPPVSSPTYTDVSVTGNILVEGQTYCYVVSAVGAGGESGNSNEACFVIPISAPATPTGLTGTVH